MLNNGLKTWHYERFENFFLNPFLDLMFTISQKWNNCLFRTPIIKLGLNKSGNSEPILQVFQYKSGWSCLQLNFLFKKFSLEHW